MGKDRWAVIALGAVTVAGLVAAAGVYFKARHEANALFDYQLKQIALALRDHAATALAVVRSDQDNAEQELVIQMWDNTGLYLYHSMEKDSPADRAGLHVGDVILTVDGKDVDRSTALPAEIARRKPGTTAQLTVWRHGVTREVAVTIGALPEAPEATAEARHAAPTGRLGLALRTLRPEEQRAAQTEGTLVVEAVSGPAARAGMRPGDVILRLNDTPVSSVEQLRQLAEKTGQHVALLIQRDTATLYLPIPLG